MLTRIYPFDPEMNLRTHFHFNSFPGHYPRTATQREWEKRNMKVTKNTERTHPPILNQPPRAPIQPPRPPIQPPRAPSPKRNCLRREWEKEPTAPIYLTPVTPSSARRSPPRPTPNPDQPVDHRSSHSDHRAKHFITVSFPSPVHRSDLYILYIYFYIFIYLLIFIYSYKYIFIYIYKYIFINIIIIIIIIIIYSYT